MRDDGAFVSHLEVDDTVDYLFEQFPHDFVDNSPMTLWTIVPGNCGQFSLGNRTFCENTLLPC